MSVFGIVSYGQEAFVFRNTLDDTANVKINYNLASSHFLGETIAKKMLLLKETYTYIEKGTPMSPGDKVIVRKPTIYYAVRKLNKFYKKQVKKDRIEESVAKNDMVDVLDKCFVIFDQDTTGFEEYLKGLKHAEDIKTAFDRIVLQ
jgi:hypothetical protein